MEAAVLTALGEAPRFATHDEPDVQAGETFVTVSASALKQLDRALASGRHYASPAVLPVICGTDGVGLTESGERVYFAVNRSPFGAMAKLAPASWTVPLPTDLSDVLAAAIVNPAIGAWLPLSWRGRLSKGETVLILGATGATGRIAVTASRLLGAGRIIAAGRNRAVLDCLGADEIVDLGMDDTQLRMRFAELVAAGIDLVVDYVWGRPAELLIASFEKIGGERPARLVSVGEMAGPTVTLPSTVLRGSWLEIIGSGTGNFPSVDALRSTVAEILEHAQLGAIGIDLEEQPLSNVEKAWNETSSRRVVLRPWGA